MEIETSEQQVDAVMLTIVGCRKRLQRSTELLEYSYPSYQHNIPDPSSMNISKLGNGGALTLSICNGESKTSRLIVEKSYEATEDLGKDNSDNIHVLDVDCWNHLRNLRLGSMTKSLSTLLDNTTREELYGIDSRLKVLTSIGSMLCAVDKYFSLCDNYTKGKDRSSAIGLRPITMERRYFTSIDHQVPSKTYLSRGQ